MTEKRVGMLLDSLPELQALRGDLQRLAVLQNTLADVLPGNLADSTNVAFIKAGELTLTSHSPAVVAKLRQIAPRILTFLQSRGFEITGIRLQVQVSTRDNPLPQKQIFLGPEARTAIESLSRRLGPSPLHSALTRLGNRGKTALK
ncbi:MAG TPA: DciA family protein [Burkholderiales bacterium]